MDTLGNRAAGQGGLRREERTEDVAVGGRCPSEHSARGITSCVSPTGPTKPGEGLQVLLQPPYQPPFLEQLRHLTLIS